MKQITYYPRKNIASVVLNFATPEDSITLNAQTPTEVKDETHEWLLENEEEYKECVKQKIIFVEDAKPPDSSPKPLVGNIFNDIKSGVEAGVDAVKESGEATLEGAKTGLAVDEAIPQMVEAEVTGKTATTTKKSTSKNLL